MQNPDGPVATFAAAAVDYPHWNKMLLDGLSEQVINREAHDQPATIGQAVTAMRAHLAGQPIDPVTWVALNRVDGSKAPWDQQRRGHLQMYSLFGDPATRWPMQFSEMELKAPASAQPGRTLRLEGRLADAKLANASLTAEVRRGWSSLAGEGIVGPSTGDLVLARAEGAAAGGRFRIELKLPGEVAAGTGRPHLVATVWARGSANAQAIAARRIELKDTTAESSGTQEDR
jgi:hypothetical protein